MTQPSRLMEVCDCIRRGALMAVAGTLLRRSYGGVLSNDIAFLHWVTALTRKQPDGGLRLHPTCIAGAPTRNCSWRFLGSLHAAAVMIDTQEPRSSNMSSVRSESCCALLPRGASADRLAGSPLLPSERQKRRQGAGRSKIRCAPRTCCDARRARRLRHFLIKLFCNRWRQ